MYDLYQSKNDLFILSHDLHHYLNQLNEPLYLHRDAALNLFK
jgi:hypothetical protein